MKPADALRKLGASVGVDVDKAFAKAKENMRRLQNCKGPHIFRKMEEEGPLPLSKYFCTSCGGEISARDHRWYQEGLEQGRRQRTT